MLYTDGKQWMTTTKNSSDLWARERASDKPHHISLCSMVTPPRAWREGRAFNKVSDISVFMSFSNYLKRIRRRNQREKRPKREIIRMPFAIDSEGVKLWGVKHERLNDPRNMSQGNTGSEPGSPGCMHLGMLWRVVCRRLLTWSYATKQAEFQDE